MSNLMLLITPSVSHEMKSLNWFGMTDSKNTHIEYLRLAADCP